MIRKPRPVTKGQAGKLSKKVEWNPGTNKNLFLSVSSMRIVHLHNWQLIQVGFKLQLYPEGLDDMCAAVLPVACFHQCSDPKAGLFLLNSLM